MTMPIQVQFHNPNEDTGNWLPATHFCPDASHLKVWAAKVQREICCFCCTDQIRLICSTRLQNTDSEKHLGLSLKLKDKPRTSVLILHHYFMFLRPFTPHFPRAQPPEYRERNQQADSSNSGSSMSLS